MEKIALDVFEYVDSDGDGGFSSMNGRNSMKRIGVSCVSATATLPT